MLGPNDPLNPDIPDPDEDVPAPPLGDEPDDDFGEGDAPEAEPREPGTESEYVNTRASEPMHAGRVAALLD